MLVNQLLAFVIICSQLIIPHSIIVIYVYCEPFISIFIQPVKKHTLQIIIIIVNILAVKVAHAYKGATQLFNQSECEKPIDVYLNYLSIHPSIRPPAHTHTQVVVSH